MGGYFKSYTSVAEDLELSLPKLTWASSKQNRVGLFSTLRLTSSITWQSTFTGLCAPGAKNSLEQTTQCIVHVSRKILQNPLLIQTVTSQWSGPYYQIMKLFLFVYSNNPEGWVSRSTMCRLRRFCCLKNPSILHLDWVVKFRSVHQMWPSMKACLTFMQRGSVSTKRSDCIKIVVTRVRLNNLKPT